MIVSIADVFDALRSNRPYRQGLASDRIKAIMSEQGNPAFNQKLLKRFVNIMGLFPVGNLVRLNTDEVGVITAEHPSDPFRPQVKIVFNERGERIEEPFFANTWERDPHGEYPRAVVEAIDPETMNIDPLTLLQMEAEKDLLTLDQESASKLTDCARACKAAARAVTLYPAAQPAIRVSLARL